MLADKNVLYLSVNLLIYKIFTHIPLLIIQSSGSAATLSVLYSGAISFFIILVLFKLSGRNKTVLFADAKSVFGKIGSYIASGIALFYILISGIIALRCAAQLSLMISFPTAPVYFTAAFLTLGAFFAALGGKHATIRLHRIFVPVILAVVILTVVSTIFRGDASRLFPILGKGPEGVFGDGLWGMTLYSDAVFLLFLKPKDVQAESYKKTVIVGTVLSVLINTFTVLAFTLNLPQRVAGEGQLPMYLLMKEIYYGRFFQRIDALLLLVSSLSSMLFLAVNIVMFSRTAAVGFGIRKTKAVTVGYTVALFVGVIGIKAVPGEMLDCLLAVSGLGLLLVLILTAGFKRSRRAYETE